MILPSGRLLSVRLGVGPSSLLTRSLLVLGLLGGLGACDRAPSSVREWTPSDHDHEDQNGQVAPRPSGQRPQNDPNLVELAWARNCASCHGPRGRGDGPQAAMARPADLTRTEWQSKVTDQEIFDTIRKGKNKMPAFDLPLPVLEGLVKRIRANRAPK